MSVVGMVLHIICLSYFCTILTLKNFTSSGEKDDDNNNYVVLTVCQALCQELYIDCLV